MLYLATHCFTHADVLRLAEMLQGFGVRAAVDAVWDAPGQFQLRIPTSQVEAFFGLVGPCPVSDLAYRWEVDRPLAASV